MAVRLGQVIREARTRRGLSQEALAEIANLNRGFLGEIERGVASPTFETLVKLSDGLGERLSNLIRMCEEHESESNQSGA